ncbi:MAG: serine/threonine protein kinase [Deltaproteobacteria bacterium]|nr:serine/threonine protein kinase [Deltaproteobacteria bacterium]
MVARVQLLPEGEPRLLDRYQIVGEIASGGMATVFLARLPGVGGFQRLVAIKQLHPHLAHEQEFVEMFLDEARLAARIHHRNVVPILEIGTSIGGYYLVMEYIEGVTLARLMAQAALKKNPVPRPVLLRVVLDTLTGLGAAHDLKDDDGEPLGVVHRDCSPQNILLGVDGCTRITDFGVARASCRLHTTREGAMKGKLAYMAPEQTGGDDFDLRADLFSLAVVLWEALSSRRLFRGKTEAQTLRRLIHEPIPRLREAVPNIHPALDELCHKGLQRDPEQRFQTASDMADEVEAKAREALGVDSIATERIVEAFMKERYGASASTQRDALRHWFQATPTALGDMGRITVQGLGRSDPKLAASGSDGLGDGDPSSAAHTDRTWPVETVEKTAAPSEGDQDETHIYESTTPSAVTSEWVDEPMVPEVAATQRSEDLDERRRRGRWLIAAMVVGGLAAAFFAIRPDRAKTTETEAAATEPVEGTGAADSSPTAESTGSASAPTASASALVAAPTASAFAAPAGKGTVKPPRPGPTSAAPPATTTSKPVVPPTSTKTKTPPPVPTKTVPGGIDDLSNPYR